MKIEGGNTVGKKRKREEDIGDLSKRLKENEINEHLIVNPQKQNIQISIQKFFKKKPQPSTVSQNSKVNTSPAEVRKQPQATAKSKPRVKLPGNYNFKKISSYFSVKTKQNKSQGNDYGVGVEGSHGREKELLLSIGKPT